MFLQEMSKLCLLFPKTWILLTSSNPTHLDPDKPSHKQTWIKPVQRNFLPRKPLLSSVRGGWGLEKKRPEKSGLCTDSQDTTAPMEPPSCWVHTKQSKVASEPCQHWFCSPWTLHNTLTVGCRNNGCFTNLKNLWCSSNSERCEAAGTHNEYYILFSEKTKSLLKCWQNRHNIQSESCDSREDLRWEHTEPEN